MLTISDTNRAYILFRDNLSGRRLELRLKAVLPVLWRLDSQLAESPFACFGKLTVAPVQTLHRD